MRKLNDHCLMLFLRQRGLGNPGMREIGSHKDEISIPKVSDAIPHKALPLPVHN